MEQPERLLLDLVERLNRQLTVDEVHVADAMLESLTGPMRAVIDARPDDKVYAEAMGRLHEYAHQKVGIAVERAETRQARRELIDIEHELLALLQQIVNAPDEVTAEPMRAQLGRTAQRLADIGRNLPERDALKCLYGYVELKSQLAVEHARTRAERDAEYRRMTYDSRQRRAEWARRLRDAGLSEDSVEQQLAADAVRTSWPGQAPRRQSVPNRQGGTSEPSSTKRARE
jgi:hypothetical protein